MRLPTCESEACWLQNTDDGANTAADKLRSIAERGRTAGVFGGEKMEAAAQSILALRNALENLLGRFDVVGEDAFDADVIQALKALGRPPYASP